MDSAVTTCCGAILEARTTAPAPSNEAQDCFFIGEQPAPAPHLAHPQGCAALLDVLPRCAALRIVLITVPCPCPCPCTVQSFAFRVEDTSRRMCCPGSNEARKGAHVRGPGASADWVSFVLNLRTTTTQKCAAVPRRARTLGS